MVFLFQGMGLDGCLAVYKELDDYVVRRVARKKTKLVNNYLQDVQAKAWEIVVALLVEKGVPADELPQPGWWNRQRPAARPSGKGPAAGPSHGGGEGGASGHGGGKEE